MTTIFSLILFCTTAALTIGVHGVHLVVTDILTKLSGLEKVQAAIGGTITVDAPMSFSGTNIVSGYKFASLANPGWYIQPAGDSYISGKLGIGTSSPVRSLHLYGDSSVFTGYTTGNTGSTTSDGLLVGVDATSHGYIWNYEATSLYFGTSNATRMIILSDGKVGIGTASPGYQLQLSTNSAAKPTSDHWTVPSDRRLKENIQPFIDGLSVLEKIRPVSYVLNGKAGTPKGAPGISVIAQEIKDVAPYTVHTYKAFLNPEDTEKTELLDFDSSALQYVTINSIKEQQMQIEALQQKVDRLEKIVETLNGQR